jgi:RNA polymerase sigma-70 factor (ECF subfamily)
MPEASSCQYRSSGELVQPAGADADLIQRAKAREPDAWSEIYDRYHATVYRYCLVRLRHEADAEDAAAQCFLRALAGIHRYTDQGKPILAWLYRIAANLVADRVKQRQRRLESSLDEGLVSAFQLGPEATVDGLDLQRALDRLKQEQREVIILRFLLSLSMRDAAQMLGKSEAAVHSLQVRAIQALRSSLSK